MTTKTVEKNEYDIKAEEFMAKYGVTITTKLLYHGKHFEDDERTRDIYEITISRIGKKPWSFNFGQSISESDHKHYTNLEIVKFGCKNTIYDVEKYRESHRGFSPSFYDVLAAIQKYDFGTFENFCNEFGYSSDSIKAQRAYLAVHQTEYAECQRMFSDCLEELQEIN